MPLGENPSRPNNYDETLNHFKELKVRAKVDYPERNEASIKLGYALPDLRDCARGEDTQGIAKKYYPGWSQADFQSLLDDLDEEY